MSRAIDSPESLDIIQKTIRNHPDMSEGLLERFQAFIDDHDEDDIEPFWSSKDGQQIENIIIEIILGKKLSKARAKNMLSLGLTSRALSAALPRKGKSPLLAEGLGVSIRGRYIPGQVVNHIASFLSGKTGTRNAQMRKLKNRSKLEIGEKGVGAHHGGTRRRRYTKKRR